MFKNTSGLSFKFFFFFFSFVFFLGSAIGSITFSFAPTLNARPIKEANLNAPNLDASSTNKHNIIFEVSAFSQTQRVGGLLTYKVYRWENNEILFYVYVWFFRIFKLHFFFFLYLYCFRLDPLNIRRISKSFCQPQHFSFQSSCQNQISSRPWKLRNFHIFPPLSRQTREISVPSLRKFWIKDNIKRTNTNANKHINKHKHKQIQCTFCNIPSRSHCWRWQDSQFVWSIRSRPQIVYVYKELTNRLFCWFEMYWFGYFRVNYWRVEWILEIILSFFFWVKKEENSRVLFLFFLFRSRCLFIFSSCFLSINLLYFFFLVAFFKTKSNKKQNVFFFCKNKNPFFFLFFNAFFVCTSQFFLFKVCFIIAIPLIFLNNTQVRTPLQTKREIFLSKIWFGLNQLELVAKTDNLSLSLKMWPFSYLNTELLHNCFMERRKMFLRLLINIVIEFWCVQEKNFIWSHFHNHCQRLEENIGFGWRMK